jgi:hypothetical protein
MPVQVVCLSKARDRPAPFSTSWGTPPAACWTPVEDNLTTSRLGETSRDIRFLVNEDDVRMSMPRPACKQSPIPEL